MTIVTSSVENEAVLGGKMFAPFTFEGSEGEDRFEKAVIENYRQALGNGTFYLPIKKPVGTELKKVTDGLLLDVNDPTNPSTWIVENGT